MFQETLEPIVRSDESGHLINLENLARRGIDHKTHETTFCFLRYNSIHSCLYSWILQLPGSKNHDIHAVRSSIFPPGALHGGFAHRRLPPLRHLKRAKPSARRPHPRPCWSFQNKGEAEEGCNFHPNLLYSLKCIYLVYRSKMKQ